MIRYVAFLRGVSPVNAKMPQLKQAFEAAGFACVKTLLSSGNLAFSARSTPTATLERKAQKAMRRELGHAFGSFVRTTAFLQALVDSDPFAVFDLAPGSKRVITFLRQAPAPAVALPIERDGARVLAVVGSEVFCVYVPGPNGPVFMHLLERAFGKDITTRTFDTVARCAIA